MRSKRVRTEGVTRANKRWRKKRHIGEFTEYCFSADFECNEATFDTFLEFCDANEMGSGGSCPWDEKQFYKCSLYVSYSCWWARTNRHLPRRVTWPQGHSQYRHPIKNATQAKLAMELRRLNTLSWLENNPKVRNVVVGELVDTWNSKEWD